MEQDNIVEELDEIEVEVETEAEAEAEEVIVDELTPEPEPKPEPDPEPAIVDDDIVSIRGISGVIKMPRSEYNAKYGKNKN